MADIALPQLGETVSEGTILRWFKKVGDTVAADEPLFEISTDKVDTEVPSPVAGTVVEIRAAEGDVVAVGTVVAVVGAAGAAIEQRPVQQYRHGGKISPATEFVTLALRAAIDGERKARHTRRTRDRGARAGGTGSYKR